MKVTKLQTDASVVRSGWLTAIAIFMIVLGMIAIAFPFFATVTSTLMFGWVFIIAGIAQIVVDCVGDSNSWSSNHRVI